MAKIKGNDVAWVAHPGPQTEFLASSDFEVLYGGAAGCAKTAALLMAPIRFIEEPDHHAGIFRRTYPEIEQMVVESQPVYRALGGQWVGSKRQWRFPSGARVTFGNLETADDKYKYHGSVFTMLLFDELASWPTDELYVYLHSRLRRGAGSRCVLMIRSSCNPTGPGKSWIMKRFGIGLDGKASQVIDSETGRLRRFIPGRITDNPSLAGSEYMDTLNSLPPAKRAALRDGRWDSMEGQFFDHLPVAEFEVMPHWTIYGGFDHGFVHKAAAVFGAKDGDGHAYIFDAYERSKTPIPIVAASIHAMLGRYGKTEGREGWKVRDLTQFSAGHDIYAKRGQRGTIEDAYRDEGISFRPAVLDRINGWAKLSELFGNPDDPTHPVQPRITIHPRCVQLINGLRMLQHDPKRPEDIAKMDLPASDPDGISDDSADALRYLVMGMSRPKAKIRRMGI